MRHMSLCLPGYYGEMCSSAVPLVPVRGAGVGCVGSRPTCHLGLRDFLGLRHAVVAPFPRGVDGGTRPHPLRPEGAPKGAVSVRRVRKVNQNRVSSIRGQLPMQNRRLLLVAVVRFVLSPMHQAEKGG